MSRQSSSFCLIWPTTRPQSLWNLKEAKTLHANDKIRDETVAWHQSPQWGKKAKNNQQATRAGRVGVWGGERSKVGDLSPFPVYRSARFAHRFFSVLPRFMPFQRLLRNLVPSLCH